MAIRGRSHTESPTNVAPLAAISIPMLFGLVLLGLCALAILRNQDWVAVVLAVLAVGCAVIAVLR
jgi:hypothetical protein